MHMAHVSCVCITVLCLSVWFMCPPPEQICTGMVPPPPMFGIGCRLIDFFNVYVQVHMEHKLAIISYSVATYIICVCMKVYVC